jgi:hypothetical protein
MFIPQSKTISDILNSSSPFAIPRYQREYKWGKEEAMELIQDLTSHQRIGSGKHEELFLGNFIFETTQDNKTCVVDGQQRLTTIILLLLACKMRAKELNMIQIAGNIQNQITFVHPTIENATRGPRLIASDSIRQVFEHITDPKWDGVFPAKLGKPAKSVNKQTNRLEPIYKYFREALTEFNSPEKLSKFLDTIYEAYGFRVEVATPEEALSIFERTNARGQDLEISDLLKNHLFSKKVPDIDSSWQSIVNNSGGTLLRMLKYFYVSKRGYILKSKMYGELKKLGDTLTPQKLTVALDDFSRFYRVVKVAKEDETQSYFETIELTNISSSSPRYKPINFALQGLREFGVTQFCPVAYAAIECLIRDNGEEESAHSKKLIELFEAFEKYHFVNSAICGRVGNEVEKLYAKYSALFAKKDSNFFSTVDNLINDLKSQRASEEDFQQKFLDITYPDQISLIMYIFDRMNAYPMDIAQGKRIYDPTLNVKKRDYTVEHFLSQKFKDGSKKKSEIDNIGNLLPIYFRDNGGLGSAPPAEKIELLKTKFSKGVQSLPILDDFITKYSKDASDWNKSKIQKRAKDLAEHAYRHVWKIK